MCEEHFQNRRSDPEISLEWIATYLLPATEPTVQNLRMHVNADQTLGKRFLRKRDLEI
jgi:hypothetical protein